MKYTNAITLCTLLVVGSARADYYETHTTTVHHVQDSNSDDADLVLAGSTAAIGLSMAGVSLSETSEVKGDEAVHRRMIKEGRQYLLNMERYGESFATSKASDEFLLRLTEEKNRPENKGMSSSEVVLKLIDAEKRALEATRP